MYFWTLESDDGEAGLDNELRSLSLHELNNNEDNGTEQEEENDNFSDEGGKFNLFSIFFFDLYNIVFLKIFIFYRRIRKRLLFINWFMGWWCDNRYRFIKPFTRMY